MKITRRKAFGLGIGGSLVLAFGIYQARKQNAFSSDLEFELSKNEMDFALVMAPVLLGIKLSEFEANKDMFQKD